MILVITDPVSVGRYCYRSVRVRKSLGLVTLALSHPSPAPDSKIICKSGGWRMRLPSARIRVGQVSWPSIFRA